MSRIKLDDPPTRPNDVPEGSIVSVFRVPPEVAGMRLDLFLQGQFRRTSRTRTQYIIEVSAFDARGKRMRSSQRVQSGENIFLWRPPWDETPVPLEIPVIFEDEHLMAVNKPALIPVHPTARYHRNTVIVRLKEERPNEWLSLGHRIDRETSGVLLITKTPECDRALKYMLEHRQDIEKVYTALTWGTPPFVGEVRYEKALEMDPTSSTGVKVRTTDSLDAWASATRFLVRETRVKDELSYSKVQCTLESGRQHQIRVHLASVGTPIVGDKLYGPDDSLFTRGADNELTAADHVVLELPRHALHASSLALPHPISGEALRIEAPFPDDLTQFWESLR